VLDKDHPNCVAPRKRPFHTIIPGFLMREGRPLCSFGVMGGAMQAQAHMQLAVRMCACRQNPQSALDAPRWRVINRRELWIEDSMDQRLRSDLESRGHQLKVAEPGQFGGGQVIWRAEGGYIAASDSRKDGCAAGF
jgi:gamma-glutamyltranspeptidase/glutathione hydrolase